jgi:hypothetical protein
VIRASWIQQLYSRSCRSIRRFEVFFVLSWVEFILTSYVILDHPEGTMWTYAQLAVMCGLAFSVCSRIFCERLQRDLGRWVLYAAVAVFCGCAFGILSCVPVQAYAYLYAGGIVSALSCFSLFLLYTDVNGKSLFPLLVCGSISAVGIILLLGTALLICLLAFTMLITHVRDSYNLVILAFVVFIPAFNLFLSFLPERDRDCTVPKAFYKVLALVCLPVFGLLLLILYGYVLKIFMAGTLPVGEMNWYASLASFGFVLLYFSLRDNPIYPRIGCWLRWGGIALAPVIAAQIMGIVIRYNAYGLTTARYASMVCTAFGICVMVCALLRRRQIVLYALAGVCCIVFFLTPLNILDTPSRDQQQRLLVLLQEQGMYQDGEIVANGSLSVADWQNIGSAYKYLRTSPTKDKFPFARQVADSPVLKELSLTREGQALRLQNSRTFGIPVEGYKTAYPYSGTAVNGILTIPVGNEDPAAYDISDYCAALYDTYKDKGNVQQVDLQFQPDADTVLYFNSIRLRRDAGSDGLHINVEGYLLKR